jgi:hypothetical protein
MSTRLNDNHWRIEDYKQRMTTKAWKNILLNDDDHIVFKGHVRHLQAVKLGYGVVEVSKTPLE